MDLCGHVHVKFYAEYLTQASLLWALEDPYRARLHRFCTDTEGRLTVLQRNLWNYASAGACRSLGSLSPQVCALGSLFGNTTAVITASTWMCRFV